VRLSGQDQDLKKISRNPENLTRRRRHGQFQLPPPSTGSADKNASRPATSGRIYKKRTAVPPSCRQAQFK
jgi:hypothetical protein